MNLKLGKGFKQFLVKTGIFVVLFIAFSFLIGTQLYHYGLLDKWKIEIYGRIGYIVLFAIAGFVLLYRERLLKLASFKHKARDYMMVVASFILLVLFYLFEVNAYKFSINLFSIVLVHLILILAMLSLVLGVYGAGFIINLGRSFKKELIYFLIFGIITASLMDWVWSLWPYLSWVVLKITAFLLGLVGADFRIIQPNTIIVGNFGATIADACSGVYSVFLFTALYLFIIFVDWKKINKKRARILFIPAVVGAFLMNVLRVFLLFLIGAYVSREAAMGMYHSYTGMVFFLLYFALFWFLFYKWMKNEKTSFMPKDPLYRNSIYLMLSTLVMSIFGFIFWMINTRLFSSEQVGLVTTLISSASLIASFSVLGLGAGLVRFLPKSERKNDKINTCFTINVLVTIVISSVFLLTVSIFSPRLLFVKENLIMSLVFILFMIFNSLGGLIDSVFMAYRSSKYILLENSVFSGFKIIFPFFLVSLGAYGLFSSWMISLILGTMVSFFILIYKFGYRPRFVFYDSVIKKIGKYSFGNFIAGFIGCLPGMLLPLMITTLLLPKISAYYYMAMMIAALLFIIPNSASNSLFAEGSHNEKNLKIHVKKAGKMIALFMIPAIIIIIFLGKYVLLAFGHEYSSEGYMFLNLLAISGIFVAINSVFTSVFKVRKRIRSLIFRSLIGTIVILGLSYWFIQLGWGLLGVGWAYLIGQAVMSLLFWLIRIRRK